MKKINKIWGLLIMLGVSSLINAQESISLVGKLQVSGLPIHDVWGYTDSVTGNRYALLCASTSGLRVIDLTDLTNPVIVGSISGAGIRAIDVKTWKNYAYIVGESLSVSGKVIDLTDPTNPIQVGTFPAGHNITISDSGYLYLSTPGVRIFDLNNDPINPLQVYVDNSCNGHDISIVGNRLFDFSDNCGTRIFDITQPDTLITLGGVPASGIFHHSGWPSQNGNYLFICDELASPSENDITVWDINNLSNPIMVDSFADPSSFVHNLYIKDNYAFVSYYRAGFRLFDVSDPFNIAMVAEYDTDSAMAGPGYGGNFGLFTEWGTDTILASDEENGLYIFSISGLTTGISSEIRKYNDFILYPNPAKGSIVLEFPKKIKYKTIKIYNTVGKLVLSKIVNGQNKIRIPVNHLPSGGYYIELKGDDIVNMKKLIISK